MFKASYKAAEMEIVTFEAEDIVTASLGGNTDPFTDDDQNFD